MQQEHRQALGHGGTHSGEHAEDGAKAAAGIAAPGGKRGGEAAELLSPAPKKAKLSRQNSSASLRSLARYITLARMTSNANILNDWGCYSYCCSNDMDMDSEEYSDDEV